MAAVERIEILTDGASSTYGSDAIAGVVNIIMKKDFEGLTLNYGAGFRSQDDGKTSDEFSLTAGYSNDKGNITFAFDHQSRLGISDGARPYTAARAEDLDGDGDIEIYSAETDGWSYYGATVLDPTFTTMTASPLCDDLIAEYGDNVFKKFDGTTAWGPGGNTVCGYAYANVSYNKASIDRNTVFVDANYEVAEDVEMFARAMFVQNESFGRYAPPAAPWSNMSADNPHNPHGVDGAYGLFRWVDIGTRDGNVFDYNQDYLLGLRGEADIMGGASWEVYYHKNIADNKSVGQYYLSYGGLAYNEANGIDLGSAAGVANMKATTLQESAATFDQYYAGMGFDAFELPGGEVAHYIGAEYMEITYADIYDGQSEAGLVGGSAGNSSQGAREITAFFYEAAMPVTEDIEVNVAVRYDDYSDFGDNLAPKVSMRWQAAENVVVRASYSEAFRAPGLDEMNAATTFSAEGAIDYASGSSTERQYDTYYRSNPDLGPETSEYTNLGVAWDIMDELSLKVDYFDLSIENVISTKTVQGLITDQLNGDLTPYSPGQTPNETFYLIRSGGALDGNILEAGTGYYNGSGFQIKGMDVTFDSSFDTEFGLFAFSMVNSFILEYGTDQGGSVLDTSGWSDNPDHKAVASIKWSMGDHSLSWTSNYTAGTSEFESYNLDTDSYDISGELDSWLVHNASYTYDMGTYGRARVSVYNLTDEDPVLSSAGSYTNANLYSNIGRDVRISYSISF
jgi:iron complex outermembrane receptor protein